MTRKSVGTLGGCVLVLPQRGPSQKETTGMMIQTKEKQYYRGACWTAVKDCNLPGVR